MQHDPEPLQKEAPPQYRHKARPFIIAAAIIIAVLHALLLPSPKHGYTDGDGSFGSKDGTGAGSNDTGTAGTSTTQSPEPDGGNAPDADNSPSTGDDGTQGITEHVIPAEPEKPTLAKDNLKPAPTSKGSKAGTGSGKGFYGRSIDGNQNILFIVDHSGSMGTTSPEGKSRLEVLKINLLRSIREAANKENPKSIASKAPKGTFAIFVFDCSYQAFPENSTLPFASTSSISKAQQFINDIDIGGGTNFRGVWAAAIPFIKKHHINTVYFLTDGEGEDILDMLKALPKRTTVHTFAIGTKSDLLKNIAKAHHGTYSVKF